MTKNNCVKRIAIIGMTKNKGGIESVVMNIYRNIDRKRVQFDFLLLHDAEEMAYEEEVISMGARVFRIMYAQRESLKKAEKTLYDFLKEHSEITGIYLHTNFPYVFPLKVAKKAGVSTRIIHAHSSAKLFEELQGVKKLKRKIVDEIIYRQIEKYPNCHIACSDLAAKSTFRMNDYVWIKNGIELDRFAFDYEVRSNLRKKYNIELKDKVIGFIGMLGPIKNPLFALDVFAKYVEKEKNAKMVFVGEGVLREQLCKRIKEYNLSDKVILTGMITNTHEWYQVIDMLLVPSLFEGFPIVLIEGQTAGVPCLVSDTITKQVSVTDLVKYKSIKETVEEWAIEIDKIIQNSNSRNTYLGKMYNAGFDINSMVNEVSRFLLGDNVYQNNDGSMYSE